MYTLDTDMMASVGNMLEEFDMYRTVEWTGAEWEMAFSCHRAKNHLVQVKWQQAEQI